MCPPAKVNGVWPFNDAWLRTSVVVDQTPGATQRCLNPGFSERIRNSRRTGYSCNNAARWCEDANLMETPWADVPDATLPFDKRSLRVKWPKLSVVVQFSTFWIGARHPPGAADQRASPGESFPIQK